MFMNNIYGNLLEKKLDIIYFLYNSVSLWMYVHYHY